MNDLVTYFTVGTQELIRLMAKDHFADSKIKKIPSDT